MSDLFTSLGTAQSASMTLPAGSHAVYVNLLSQISGAWHSRSYIYLTMPGHLVAVPDVRPQDDYTYNDNVPRDNYTHHLTVYFPDLDQYVPYYGYLVDYCYTSNPNILAVPEGSEDINGNAMDFSKFSLTYTAPYMTAPGHQAVTCHANDDDIAINPEFQLQHAMSVFDGTPVITSIQRLDNGSSTFIQGEGVVNVKIIGHDFGANQSLASGQLTVSGSGVTVGQVTSWTDEQIVAPFTIGSAALGTYTVTVTSRGAAGQGFQAGGQTPSQSQGTGQISVSPAPSVKLIQFGWGNNQDLWKATTFTSNGDSEIGQIVWSDPNGDGNVTVNEPAALTAGSNAPYLSSIVLRTSSPVTITAQLQITVVPGDFQFPMQSISFVNGVANVSNINLSGSMPNVISNKSYQFQWAIRFSPALSFQTFRTTTHTLYLMHSIYAAPLTQYRITTKRLDYVTRLAQGLSDLVPVVGQLSSQLVTVNPKFDSSQHIRTPDNLWAALDGLPPDQNGLDCESLSAIGAAQLQQLGYPTANVRRAYPTGAAPTGDTNATSQESETVNSLVYSLSFYNGNYFEGFIYLSAPDVTQPTAFTVEPPSNGTLGATGCTVSPTSSDNRIAFRVLTSTYVLLGVHYQEWYWDINQNQGGPPNPPKFGQIPLPSNNCPPQELTQ